FQAEDGIRDRNVTGVQTCALPISGTRRPGSPVEKRSRLLTRGKPSMGVSLQLGEGVLPPTMKLRRVAVCWQVSCGKSSGFPVGGGPGPVGEGEDGLSAPERMKLGVDVDQHGAGSPAMVVRVVQGIGGRKRCTYP